VEDTVTIAEDIDPLMSDPNVYVHEDLIIVEDSEVLDLIIELWIKYYVVNDGDQVIGSDVIAYGPGIDWLVVTEDIVVGLSEFSLPILYDDITVAEDRTVDAYIPVAAVFLFKDKNINNDTDPVTATWVGKTDLSPVTNPVYLQIYNRNSTTWETIDVNNTASVDTDFVLNATIESVMSDYYDAENWISFRVYQMT